MTAVRGMNELVQRNLVKCIVAGQTGRKKIFFIDNKKEYWKMGRSFLINPVRKVIYVENIPENIEVYKSGLTALSEQTMLGEPDQKVFAAESKMEQILKVVQVSKEQAEEEKFPMVELMRYNISMLTDTEYADSVSVILSLKEHDERIEIAIDELMEGNEWYVE